MTEQFKRSTAYNLYPELFDPPAVPTRLAPSVSYRSAPVPPQPDTYPSSPYYWRSYGYSQGPYAYYDFDPIRVYGSYLEPFPRPYTYAYGEFPQPLMTEKPYHVPPTVSPFTAAYQESAWRSTAQGQPQPPQATPQQGWPRAPSGPSIPRMPSGPMPPRSLPSPPSPPRSSSVPSPPSPPSSPSSVPSPPSPPSPPSVPSAPNAPSAPSPPNVPSVPSALSGPTANQLAMPSMVLGGALAAAALLVLFAAAQQKSRPIV